MDRNTKVRGRGSPGTPVQYRSGKMFRKWRSGLLIKSIVSVPHLQKESFTFKSAQHFVLFKREPS